MIPLLYSCFIYEINIRSLSYRLNHRNYEITTERTETVDLDYSDIPRRLCCKLLASFGPDSFAGISIVAL
jgi:hypothetical protein